MNNITPKELTKDQKDAYDKFIKSMIPEVDQLVYQKLASMEQNLDTNIQTVMNQFGTLEQNIDAIVNNPIMLRFNKFEAEIRKDMQELQDNAVDNVAAPIRALREDNVLWRDAVKAMHVEMMNHIDKKTYALEIRLDDVDALLRRFCDKSNSDGNNYIDQLVTIDRRLEEQDKQLDRILAYIINSTNKTDSRYMDFSKEIPGFSKQQIEAANHEQKSRNIQTRVSLEDLEDEIQQEDHLAIPKALNKSQVLNLKGKQRAVYLYIKEFNEQTDNRGCTTNDLKDHFKMSQAICYNLVYKLFGNGHLKRELYNKTFKYFLADNTKIIKSEVKQAINITIQARDEKVIKFLQEYESKNPNKRGRTIDEIDKFIKFGHSETYYILDKLWKGDYLKRSKLNGKNFSYYINPDKDIYL